MREKTKKLIILLCLLLLLIGIGKGGYTYAKYRTTEKGGGQADIAKWSFKVGKENEQIQNIQLVNTVDKDTLVNGKIAPGTSGQFFINLDATDSEVGVDYEVKFENEKNKPSNIIFSYSGQKFHSLGEITAIKGKIGVDEENKSRRIQILWTWEYETGIGEEIYENDILDTQEGIENLNYTFDVNVIGTQSR